MTNVDAHILVTGSEGLIGKSLISYLNNLGIKTRGIDIRATDANEVGDICNADDVTPKLKNCSGVIHLAAISRVAIAHKNPELCIATNHEASKRIALEAKQAGVKWFIYASSREVYGHVKEQRISESHPLNPVNIYGETKLKSEEYVDSLHSSSFNSAIVRFSNVFGQHYDHATRVIPAFVAAAYRNQALYIEGGENAFDFTFVDDVVDAITRMVSRMEAGQNLSPMHITTGQATSLNELARLALTIFNSESRLLKKSPRDFDVSSFSGDPGKAFEQLAWRHRSDSMQSMLRLYATRCGFEHTTSTNTFSYS